MTKEADIATHLGTLTQLDWEPLFSLIPDVEQATGLDVATDQKRALQQAEVIDRIEQKFHELVYRLGIVVVFDWTGWRIGFEALDSTKTDYSQYDLVVLCRFVTAIVRNDRFCEGYISGQFAKGTVLKLLKALKQRVEATTAD